MPELVGVIDTGVFCCWLEVPGRATAGSPPNVWDNARANSIIDTVVKRNGTLILPNSVVIETANHIANAPHSRRGKAIQLFERVLASLEGRQPWRQFEESGRVWTPDWYQTASIAWPSYADRSIGLADYSIATIARYFNELGSEVLTLTTDVALQAEVGHLRAPEKRSRRKR